MLGILVFSGWHFFKLQCVSFSKLSIFIFLKSIYIRVHEPGQKEEEDSLLQRSIPFYNWYLVVGAVYTFHKEDIFKETLVIHKGSKREY